MVHNQANEGLEQVENKLKIQPNQLNSAQHRHGPSLGDHWRQPNKIGLKVAHLGCGRTLGGLPRAQPCQIGSYRLSKDGSQGQAQV